MEDIPVEDTRMVDIPVEDGLEEGRPQQLEGRPQVLEGRLQGDGDQDERKALCQIHHACLFHLPFSSNSN